MAEYTPKKVDKTEDIRMVNDFRDELERIKQKLASDFTKYSELNKNKSKKKENNINQPRIINNQENYQKKNETKDILYKIPTMEELRIKYGLVPNKQITSESQSNISTTLNQNSNNTIIKSDDNIHNNFMKKIDIKKKNNLENNRTNNNNIFTSKNLKINNYNLTSIDNQNITTLGHNEFRKKYANLDNDDNYEDDVNENEFSFKNIKKISLSKTETNIDNYNYNYINREHRRIESPNNILNNNSNNNTSLLLNSKLDQQIKIINEKSENNRLEEEKTQMKIKQIENKLQLDERLTHNNREIRKNALRELSDMCQKDFNTNEDRQKAFDYFSPWIKYCLEETNSYVIPECLNFFIIFNTLFPNFLNTSMKDFFDNVERFISFGMISINESCIKIFFMLFNDKKLFNQAFNELIKLIIKSGSLKVIKFIQEIISILFDKNMLQENYIKILFEKIIQIYCNINNKNIEKKKIFEKLIKSLYYYIEDDYQIIKKNIKLSSDKDLDILFNKINSSNFKKNIITYSLYPRPIQTDIDTHNNNNNDCFNYNDNINDRLLTDKSNGRYKSIYDNKTPKKNNNNAQININGEVNDLISILPNEFFEYRFAVQFQAKMQILENANEILNKIKFVKDKDKNLIDVYKTINYSIEDSNILIHLEGIKLFENICRLINEYINLQKLKLLLEKCFDKLKDKKSIIKNELFNLFNIVIEYKCFELNKFLSFILQYCCNERNDNSIIKLGLLEYIKSLFFQENKKVQKQIYEITEKDYLIYTKKIVNIIEKESLSLIKDLCSDLLIIFKRKINSQRTFYELIDTLPNHRKKIIHTEEKNEMNENSYKKNLKQIKSSYSFSNAKKKNRNTRSLSNFNYNNSNSNSFRNESFSHNSIKNLKNYNKINLRMNNNTNINSSKNPSKKTNLNNLNISLNNSSQRKNRVKNNKNINDIKAINKTEIGEENINNNKINNLSKKNNNNKINNNSNNNNISSTNMDSLTERKNTLLKSIENINEDTIEKYSKIIIKDFLVFIKKICKQKNEDLSSHFELIFMIYEKIFNRIIFIMNENQNKKQNILKYKKLIDELMKYLSKIFILTPGIQQIKGSKKFNILLFEKYLCIFKNLCFNKEKYYMHILLNLYKLCEGTDEDFPKNFDPKLSVIFFINYVKKGNNEINSKKILNIIKEFIAETNILSLSEKGDLLEGIELNDEEESNIIIDKDTSNDNINNNIDNNNNDNDNILSQENEIKNNINENLSLRKDKANVVSDDSKDNILDTSLKEDEEFHNTKLQKNDLDKIEQSIKIMSSHLNLTNMPTKENSNNNKEIEINKNNIDIKKSKSPNNNNNDVKMRKNKVLDNEEIKRNMNAIHIPLSVLKNKLTLNNKKKLLLKINSSNKSSLNNSNDNIKTKNNNNINNNNNNSEKVKDKINPQENKNKTNNNAVPLTNNPKTYIQTINQIIKMLNNESTEEGIFNLAIWQFLKLSSVEQKSDYINFLQKSLETPVFLKNTSINVLLNFYDFILSILSLEILKFSNEEKIIIKLQNLAQYLFNFRKINDMFKVMLFLLKKYFPKDLNKKIEDISLVMIKIIAYLLKELLKNINKEKINGRDIICEINDLFSNTPPSTLTTLTPNCTFYQNIFTLLKSITDEIAAQDKKELSGIIQYLKEKKIICDDYVQYLIRLNNTFSN